MKPSFTKRALPWLMHFFFLSLFLMIGDGVLTSFAYRVKWYAPFQYAMGGAVVYIFLYFALRALFRRATRNIDR